MDVSETNRIDKALDSLLIKTKGEIYTRIEQVSFDVLIDNTLAKCYCYCLKSDGNGNLRMEDLVDYKLPLGILGQLVHPVLVKPKLKEIFDYRQKKLIELFGEFKG